MSEIELEFIRAEVADAWYWLSMSAISQCSLWWLAWKFRAFAVESEHDEWWGAVVLSVTVSVMVAGFSSPNTARLIRLYVSPRVVIAEERGRHKSVLLTPNAELDPPNS